MASDQALVENAWSVMNDPVAIQRDRLLLCPVVPARMEFAWTVRQTILDRRPRAVGVELPVTLQEPFLRAVDRLPRLSVLAYPSGHSRVYVPVEVTDPIVEALRTAREIGAERVLLEPDFDQGPIPREPYPDTYALARIGASAYLDACTRAVGEPGFPVRRRASGIAHALLELLKRKEGVVLAVLGIDVLKAVLEALDRSHAIPLSRVRRQGITVMNLHPDSLPEVFTEMPFVQAVYERRRSGLPPEPEPAPSRQDRQSGPFLVLGGAANEPRSAWAAVDRVARRVGPPDQILDRQRVLLRLFAEAERRYRESTGERLAPWQRRAFGRFSRNLALTSGQLLADLHDLAVAARGVADDNLAWELWSLGASFPGQSEAAEIPTARITAESMGQGVRWIRFRRRLHKPKLSARPRGLRGRRREARPGEWLEAFDGKGLCSYPPEDVLIEGYGHYLKKKGKSILSEERSRSEPFTTSLLDGVDVRETIRNWHLHKEGPRLWVRERGRVSGEVGSVVVIFDEDGEERYPYRMSWLGEHEQESDMAFYATDPAAAVVGPGIMRAEYGGFLLSYPPRRMADVWSDEDYAFALSKAERLLAAALDYSVERLVAYVAARPPRTFMKTVADRWGRKILYIPIGQLSPVTLKKIRIVHILDGHDRRAIARDYLW